ncbi:MAG: response regulator transcription factor [Ignavibacteria bacterium]|nr:response regulator transcription factor [Ignavibacteria bacterium]
MAEVIKILLVEDDKNLGTVLKEFLEVKGFDVVHCYDGQEAFQKYEMEKFDLCIADVMMPKLDGFSLAKSIVAQSNIPIIFLTAKAMLKDKLEGFKIGADDYITKPFSMEELIMRIYAVMNRVRKNGDKHIHSKHSIGKYNFDYDQRVLSLNSVEKQLTSKEAELLCLLCMNKNNLVERDIALKKIWKSESYFTSRSMDVYISKLRGYLKNDPSIEILNIHGAGFKLIEK